MLVRSWQDVTPQGRPVRQGDVSVWSRALSDGSVAVALYNEGETPLAINVPLTDLGFSPTEKVAVRNLWKREEEGTVTGHYPAQGKVTIASHATRLLRMRRAGVFDLGGRGSM